MKNARPETNLLSVRRPTIKITIEYMDGEEEVIDNLIAWFPSGPHIQNISWREFDETPEGRADHLVTLDMSNVRKFTAVAEKKDLQPEAPQAAWGFSVSPNDVGPDDDVTEIL